jgi:hypothetical protein
VEAHRYLNRDLHSQILDTSGAEISCSIFKVLLGSNLLSTETGISLEGRLQEFDDMLGAILDGLCEVIVCLSEADSFDGDHIFQRPFVTIYVSSLLSCVKKVSAFRFVHYLESWHSNWSAKDDQSQEGASFRLRQ